MSGKRNSSTLWFLPMVMLLILALSCNMPGWGDEATETPQPIATIKGAGEATSTPVEDEMVGDTEEGGIEELVTEEVEQGEASAMEFTPCAPLPPANDPVVVVTNESDLREQAFQADPGTTILIEPGVYDLEGAIQIVNDGITLRSSSGIREDVILDGGGMLTGLIQVILIEADDVTVADLSIRNGGEHGVSVQGSDRPTLYNLHILDTGYQLVKVNPVGDGSEDGILACSRLEYSVSSPEEYTNGISAHNAHRWTVRDNQWYRIRTPGNTPAPAILFWSGSTETIVERNILIDCFQGIAFGNSSHDEGDHVGGIVRNNFIYASQLHDSVIEMVHATGWLVAHNTALLLNPNGLDWGMEARFADTTGTFANNLTNMRIWHDRDGAASMLIGNMENLMIEWLRNPTIADLHLLGDTLPPIDAAEPLPEVPSDIDGNPRPNGGAPDVGADEFSEYEIYIPLVD